MQCLASFKNHICHANDHGCITKIPPYTDNRIEILAIIHIFSFVCFGMVLIVLVFTYVILFELCSVFFLLLFITVQTLSRDTHIAVAISRLVSIKSIFFLFNFLISASDKRYIQFILPHTP